MVLFVKNQYIKEPCGGKELGYRLELCASRSASSNCGSRTGRFFLGRRDPCEGGLKRSGFSRIRLLSVTGALADAARVRRGRKCVSERLIAVLDTHIFGTDRNIGGLNAITLLYRPPVNPDSESVNSLLDE